MSTLSVFTPQDVLAHMGKILPLLTPAVERSDGRYEPGDVIALILQGVMTLWASIDDDGAIEAVCVTQILHFPRARVLSMPFLGGKNIGRWRSFEGELIDWARKQGCTQIEGYDARNGAWARLLGWNRRYIAIGKEI